MTADELKELKKGIAITASYFGRDLLPEAIQLMAEDLSDLPFEKISQAFLRYRRDPKNRAMPLPAQIRAIVDPKPDPESEGREIIERVVIAITKFGYTQFQAAMEFIGPVGKRIADAHGGWTALCESNFIHNPAMIAQARTRATDLIKYGDSFRSEPTTHIEAPQEAPQLESKKFEAMKAFRQYQEQVNRVEIEIPSDEERNRMIKELLNKANQGKQL